MKKIIIGHVYAGEMNVYGDLGNIITLVRRLEWRGYEAEVRRVEVGKPFDFAAVDIIFGGGGQDTGQMIICRDLVERGDDIRQAVAGGLPTLMICGLYQLFGRGFATMDGREIPGIDVFRASTIGGTKRMVGNAVIDSPYGRLVGFENHSGATLLEPGQETLGKVRKGYGNDGRSGQEGAVVHNAIGTYLHGPILPKNPRLADHLILTALKRRYNVTELEPLDDTLEQMAAASAAKRPQ